MTEPRPSHPSPERFTPNPRATADGDEPAMIRSSLGMWVAYSDVAGVIEAAATVAAEYAKLRVEAGSPWLDRACSELALAVSRLPETVR